MIFYETPYYGSDTIDGDYIKHYQVKGAKHGVRRWQNEDGSLTPEGRIHYGVGEARQKFNTDKDLSTHMRKFKYIEYTTLKSAKQVEEAGGGSCHDQVMYEYEHLKAMGKDPKAKFMIEYNEGTGQGGMTHSIVYYKDGDKYKYFENAWGGNEGIKTFDSEKALTDYFKKQHKNNSFGDNKQYPQFDITDFDPSKHKPGEDLQQFIDKVYEEPEPKKASSPKPVSTEKQERILKNFYKKDLDEKSQKEVDRFKKQLSSIKSEAIETKKSEAKGLEEAYNKRVKEITKETPMPKKGSGPDANRIFRKELQAYYKKQTSDKTLKSLSEQYLKKRKEICGVYLNELGFEDNEKNRDRLLRMLKP